MQNLTVRLASALSLVTLVAACGPGAVNTPPNSDAAAKKQAEAAGPRPNMPTDQISNPTALLLADYVSDLSPINASMTPSGFIENGYFRNAAPPEALQGLIFGSFGEERDKTTGYTDITFGRTEAPETIYVPMITGPSSLNMSAYFVDDAGSVIGQPIDIHGIPLWSLLEIDLPACEDCATLTLRVDDSGTGWGQWMAVGQPQILAEMNEAE